MAYVRMTAAIALMSVSPFASERSLCF
uniref:Uncharacterized protein n=1 Tax=Rhizophora mucronata TaxID=61149 RepID=A0A2P2NZ14_RHIMU